MAYTDIYRKEELKNWQELPDLFLPPETVAFYNQKIETTRVDIAEPGMTIPDEDDTGENIDYTYIKYLMRLCLNDYKQYAESKGVNLKNDKINITTILNEIIDNTLPESYYINRKYFFHRFFNISSQYYDYNLMDQAIKFNDQRMIHYFIFKKQEKLENWLDDIVNPPPSDDDEDDDDEDDEDLIPPTIESGFYSDNCIVCCIEKPNILNIPCLHISTCESCENIGELTKCSICRMVIQRKVKI